MSEGTVLFLEQVLQLASLANVNSKFKYKRKNNKYMKPLTPDDGFAATNLKRLGYFFKRLVPNMYGSHSNENLSTNNMAMK